MRTAARWLPLVAIVAIACVAVLSLLALPGEQPVEEEKFYVGLPEDTPPVPYKNGWPLPCEDGAFGCYYGGD